MSGVVSGARLFACSLVACTLTLASALAAPVVAHAAPMVYVALGDSYTSGPYTGVSTSAACVQSANNYPHLVAAALQPPSFTDVSCAGAATANMAGPQTNGTTVLPPQLDAVTPATTLVTVGIGANDIQLINVILECFDLDLLNPGGSACVDNYTAGGVDQLTQSIDATAPKLAAVYQGIHARSPDARVLAVGYPEVLPINGSGCWPLAPLSPTDVSWLASVFVALNNMIETVATDNDVQYVDTYTPTIGYDVCQAIGHAGFTALLPTSGVGAPVHPNALGEQLMANAVINAIDNPPVVTPSVLINPQLKLTKAAISASAVSARGSISTSYRGRVTVAFHCLYRSHAVNLHGTALVTHGRWHLTLSIPHAYRGKLHAGTLTAASGRQSTLGAGTAHTRV
jgi:lysophospholipase L1-like esterase